MRRKAVYLKGLAPFPIMALRWWPICWPAFMLLVLWSILCAGAGTHLPVKTGKQQPNSYPYVPTLAIELPWMLCWSCQTNQLYLLVQYPILQMGNAGKRKRQIFVVIFSSSKHLIQWILTLHASLPRKKVCVLWSADYGGTQRRPRWTSLLSVNRERASQNQIVS